MRLLGYSILVITLLALAACSKQEEVLYTHQPDTYTIRVKAKSDMPLKLLMDGQEVKLENPTVIDASELFIFEKGKSVKVQVFAGDNETPIIDETSSATEAKDLAIDKGYYFSLIKDFIKIGEGIDPLDALGVPYKEGKVNIRIIANSNDYKYAEPVDIHIIEIGMDENYMYYTKSLGVAKDYVMTSGVMTDVLTFNTPREDFFMVGGMIYVTITKAGTRNHYIFGEALTLPQDGPVQSEEDLNIFMMGGFGLDRLSDQPWQAAPGQLEPANEAFRRDIIIINEDAAKDADGKVIANPQIFVDYSTWHFQSVGAEIAKQIAAAGK